MKLDIAAPGKTGWKTLLDFPVEQTATVRAAVRSLIKASSNQKLAFRMQNDAGEASCSIDKDACEWRLAE